MSKPEEKKASEDAAVTKTNGDKHNLLPDEDTWLIDAKNDMEEYLEENGVYIRQ